MPTDDRSSSARPGRYSRQTLRPIHNLLFVLPLLVFFHVGAARYGTGLYAPRDLGRLLGYFGATAAYLPGLLIIAVLLAQHLRWPGRGGVRIKVLAGMAGESLAATAPLAAMSYLAGMMLAAGDGGAGATAGPAGAAAFDRHGLLGELLRDTGAGLYEEFIFRLAFISLAVLVFVDVFELRKDAVVVLAILASAVLFSLYHFPYHQFADGLAFPWKAFLFRAAAGVYLGALFALRGFGIAVGAHTAYNILAFLTSPQA